MRLEYNSIKHGNRAIYGGGKFQYKISKNANENWRELIKSDYGSFFYSFKNIKEIKNHFTISHNSVLWNPEDMFHGINFIGILINNLIVFLTKFNKKDVTNLKFKTLSDIKDYTLPWKNRIGTGSFRLGSDIDVETVKFYSKEEIFRSYDKPKK